VGLALAVALGGCASGPRPVPAQLGASERLAFAEEALLGARATAAFDVEATGPHAARFTGTLELTGTGALALVAEGRLDREDLKLELDALHGEPNRSVTKGASVSGSRGGAASKLGEALGLGLVRQGLLHDLVALGEDRLPDHAGGGYRQAVQAVDVHDGAADTADGQSCHRVDFTVQVDGQRQGEASLCIADATGLPVLRRAAVHSPEGDLTQTERFRWTLKQ
jgi:hypothetical protein